MHYLFLALAFIAGAVLPIQIGLNTMVARGTSNPIWAVGISFVVGSIAIFSYFLITRQTWPSFNSISAIPNYAWLGGLLGAVYVTITIIVAPKIGAATLISVVIAGQMIVAILLDHYGALNFAQHVITWPRILGSVLIVLGVVLIQRN